MTNTVAEKQVRHERINPALVALAIALLGIAGWRVLHHARPTIRAAERALLAKADPTLTTRLARAAILNAPLDGRGYRILAESLLAQGRANDAAQVFFIAAARAPRDLPSQMWMIDHELSKGQSQAALLRLDHMLRVQPEIAQKLMPVMVDLAARPQTQPLVKAMLEGEPPWRPAFLRSLSEHVSDVSLVYKLVDGLRRSKPGLGESELRSWIDRLVRDGQWGPAYMTWVDSLPAAQHTAIANVFNGGFESEPTQLGFDWRMRRLNGATITRSPDPGASGKVALRIEFANQRVPFQHIRQLLALAPGHYRFTGQSRMEQLESDRGLVWGLQCVGVRKSIMESEPFRGDHGWRAFQQDFILPAGACEGQWLTLTIPARAPSERQVSGVAWFDRIAIERIEGE